MRPLVPPHHSLPWQPTATAAGPAGKGQAGGLLLQMQQTSYGRPLNGHPVVMLQVLQGDRLEVLWGKIIPDYAGHV